MDLRKQVEQYVSRAIDSCVNYTGKEYDQNRWNWSQITTDRILAAVMNSLPDPIDVRTKYETDGKGIYINIQEEEEGANRTQLDFLSHYSEDQGFNRYYFTYTDYLKGLYMLPDTVVQSGHDQNHSDKDGDNRTQDQSPNDKEPSKVR